MLRAFPWIETAATELRYALRTLRLNRGYSAAVVLTLALGIGANCAMFSIINAVVLRPLPYPDSERIISPSLKDTQRGDLGIVDEWTYGDWVRSAKSVTLAMTWGQEMVFTFPSGPESVTGNSATAAYFDVLGTRPLIGRVYTAEEDRVGGPEVVVLSEQLWRRAFNADGAILGKTLTIEGKPTTVIGVMPESFTTPKRAQFWIPQRLTPSPKGTSFFYRPIARLEPGVSMAAARAELAAIIQRGDPERMEPDRGRTPILMTLHERRFGSNRRPLLLLLGAVGILLLIACANLANLSLARVTRREREFAVRLALGASRWRLVRTVLAECVVLAVVGAAGGLLLARGCVAWFVRLSPRLVGNPEGIRVDGTVLAFSLAVAVVSGLLFGLLPALASARGGALGGALSSGSTRAIGSRRQQWVRRTLVVTQLATALVLLTGAGVVARTFWRVATLDMGFRSERLMFAGVSLPKERYSDATATAFFDELLARIKRDPAVKAAALAAAPPPLSGIMTSWSSADATGKGWKRLDVVAVDPGYLEMLGAQLTKGRWINERDGAGAPKVGILNEAGVRVMSPGVDPIGKPTPFGRDVTVIGVMKDIRQTALEAAPTPVIYVPSKQVGRGMLYANLAIRAFGSADALEGTVRRLVQSMDPALVPPTFETMDHKLANAVAPRRFIVVLLGLFAVLAGLLAVVGLYGVLSYVVAERTREIGIRVALGADASRVRGLVIGQGMALTAIGIVVGVGVSLLAVRALTSTVYEMSVYDPWSFTASALALAAVAWLACWVPARRASRVDPVVALRAD